MRTATVHCYEKLEKVFKEKETAWMIYFALLGAQSALVLVFVFLLFYPWRQAWRMEHPLTVEQG